MTDGRSTYYVYYHVDPDTKDIVYVGHGYKSRAWIHGTSSKYGVRSTEHRE